MAAAKGQTDRAKTAFEPPFLVLASLVLSFVLSRFFPLSLWSESLSRFGEVAGVVIIFGSVVLMAWAGLSMIRGGGSLPVHTPTAQLVVRGPYRLTRNPIYTGMVLLLVGIGFARDSWWFLVMAVATALLLRWGVILREEAYLEGKFGDEYREYAKRVRRWL
ncbi:MAG: isoprenylcysteine carboxylmethyltransferase family protein [Acidobacteria bacterium]|nr:isoprenylcysteine carboxylmethyltransferase family protein [Acidobacteriota bacterium]